MIAGLLAFLVLLGVPPAQAGTPATVIDGNTLQVAGARLRLHRIDTPLA